MPSLGFGIGAGCHGIGIVVTLDHWYQVDLVIPRLGQLLKAAVAAGEV